VASTDDEEQLLFSSESAKDLRMRFAGLPMSSMRDLMECEDVGSVAWFVHECIERVPLRIDNSHMAESRTTMNQCNTSSGVLGVHDQGSCVAILFKLCSHRDQGLSFSVLLVLLCDHLTINNQGHPTPTPTPPPPLFCRRRVPHEPNNT
jgi:hypothetical protein